MSEREGPLEIVNSAASRNEKINRIVGDIEDLADAVLKVVGGWGRLG